MVWRLLEEGLGQQMVHPFGLCHVRGFEQMEKAEEAICGEKDTGEQTQHRYIIATHRGRLCSLPLSMPGAGFRRNHSIWEVEGTSGILSSCPLALEMR